MKDMDAAWTRVRREISHVARQAAGQIEHAAQPFGPQHPDLVAAPDGLAACGSGSPLCGTVGPERSGTLSRSSSAIR